MVHRRVGKGQTCRVGRLRDTYFLTYRDGDQPTRDHLSALLQAMTRKAGVRPHVSSSNPDTGASVRAIAKEGFLVVINHESQDPHTTVRLADIDFPVARLLDMEDGREVPFTPKGGVTTLATEAPFGITRLLHVLPEHCGQTAPSILRAGTRHNGTRTTRRPARGPLTCHERLGSSRGCVMPEISRFFGLVIAMFYNDHTPPHFHVRYGDQQAIVGIDPVAIIEGRLSPRAAGMAIEWGIIHQDELRADWELAREQHPLRPIPPLE